MELHVISVFRMSGTGKNPPHNPYSFARVGVLNPLEQIDQPSMKRQGSGYQVVELAVSDSFFAELIAWFNAQLMKGPVATGKFQTGFERGGQTVVQGFEKVSASVFPGAKTA